MLVVSHDHYELTFFFSPLFDVTRHRQPHQQPYRHVQEHRQVLVSFFSVFLTEGFLSILVDFGRFWTDFAQLFAQLYLFCIGNSFSKRIGPALTLITLLVLFTLTPLVEHFQTLRSFCQTEHLHMPLQASIAAGLHIGTHLYIWLVSSRRGRDYRCFLPGNYCSYCCQGLLFVFCRGLLLLFCQGFLLLFCQGLLLLFCRGLLFVFCQGLLYCCFDRDHYQLVARFLH